MNSMHTFRFEANWLETLLDAMPSSKRPQKEEKENIKAPTAAEERFIPFFSFIFSFAYGIDSSTLR